MRWIATLYCLSFVALLGLPASAQDVKFASFTDRLSGVEGQLTGYQESCCDTSCDGVGCQRCNRGCEPSGLLFGAEFAFLQPGHSEAQTPNYDYEVAPRLWLGWQTASGLGARVRWFEYSAETNDTVAARIDALRMMTFDAEVTDTFTLGSKWNGILSGGFRYAEYHETYDITNNVYQEMKDSYGLVLGTELYRPITCNLRLFGLLRGSAMFANELLDGGDVNEDGTFFITEAQFGTEYLYELRSGASLFARAAVETQYWSGVSDGDTEDTSLGGFVFAFGITR